jgi:hypothetical protein
MNFDYGPDKSIKLRFFEEGIEKYIKDKKVLAPEVLDWLVDQAWYSWILGITNEELNILATFEKICVTLFASHPEIAEQVFRSMYNTLPEAEDRSASVREMTEQKIGSQDDSSSSKRIRGALSVYNCLFENDFKVWSTPIYASAIYQFGIPHKVQDPTNAVHVPTSTKIQTIEQIKDTVPYGDMSVFIKGFDNEIRNAGVGHESFEIHDDGSFSLRVTNPYSGETKGSGVITLTEKQLRDLTKEMHKTLWFFKVGFNIFLANNRELVEKIAVLQEMKIRDIRKEMEGFCDSRCLDIKEFNFDENIHLLKMSVQYTPKIVGEGGRAFIGTAEAWELIKREMIVPYKDQIIGCIFHLIRLFNTRKDGIPSLILIVMDETGKEVMGLEYTREQLICFLSDHKNLPVPSKGEYFDGTYKMEYNVRVPYGMAEIMRPIIDAWEDERQD